MSFQDQKALQDLSEWVAKQLSERSTSDIPIIEYFLSSRRKKKIVKQLVKQGMSDSGATSFVDHIDREMNVVSPELRRILVGKYARHMFYGAIWFIGGIALTVATYDAAVSTGRRYYLVFWGAVLYGLADFLVGFLGWSKYRK